MWSRTLTPDDGGGWASGRTASPALSICDTCRREKEGRKRGRGKGRKKVEGRGGLSAHCSGAHRWIYFVPILISFLPTPEKGGE